MTHETHHTHDPARCREMFEKLSDYIDQELDEVTCKDIEKHARDCIPCQVCLGTLKQTIDLCKKLKPVPVPKEFSARLQELISTLS